MNETKTIVPVDLVITRIVILRGEKVLIDRDLAALYGVTTKALNQAVKRNNRRFPPDFMFRLTKKEKNELVTNCDRFEPLKHSSTAPFAFTEQGVAMLSTVLNSERAVEVNIAIMRAFVLMRKAMSSQDAFLKKLQEIDGRLGEHDEQIGAIFEAIRQLMKPPDSPRKRIGFEIKEKKVAYGK